MAESTSYCDRLLVCAMDFGTTYSGYAFSFRDKPLEIQTNPNWVAGGEKLISLKSPTCVLLKPNKEFHSFGFQAENKYSDLAEDSEHHGWYMFRRFKMALYETKNLKLDTTIEDISGQKMPALTIIAHAIRFLKKHFLNTLGDRAVDIMETDIQYVLTVPAIWDNTAKQFMRKAAQEAGIPNDQLKIALEPEAASIWCQVLTDHKLSGLSAAGSKYMVVDLGGGTADITVHQKLCDGSLKEIHKATGGAWGGTEVDKAYLQMLTDIVGKEEMPKFQKDYMEDYFDVLRDFETKKRNITTDTDGKMTFKIPATLRELAESKGCEMKERIKNSKYSGRMSWSSDKIRVEKATTKELFQKPIQLLVSHVNEILQEPNMRDIGTILLVGGFGECELLKDAFGRNFSDRSLIIPQDAGLAVLKGAVRFGHLPNIVSTRISRFVYGIEIWDDFLESEHDKTKYHVLEGRKVCKELFSKMVKLGEEIPRGKTVSKEYSGVFVGQKNTAITIYSSTDSRVKYITEPFCRKIGQITVDLPESTSLDDLKHIIAFEFGDTEIKVHVTILKTKETFELYLDLQ